jgi:hypothetical protein
MKTPTPVLLSRVRREVTSLKAAARNNGITIPASLATLLTTRLSDNAHAGAHLSLLRRQEKELRALLDGTGLQLGGSPTIGVPREWDRIVKPSAPARKRRAGHGVSKVYDSLERGGSPVVGGAIESNRQKH